MKRLVSRPTVKALVSRATALTTAIHEQRLDLGRNLEEARAQRARAAQTAVALRRLAHERDLPAEVRDIVERIDRLTERQRQVFEKILVGQANKLIAFELGVSQKTVETHRARIMRKLGATSFADLMRISMRGLGTDLHLARRS